jgi:hypothetical protein
MQEKRHYLAFPIGMIQDAFMDDAHLIEPTFTAIATRDGTYCVRMDPNADAPVLHIGSFDSGGDAEAWIRNESAAWLAKRRPRQAAPRRRIGNVK